MPPRDPNVWMWAEACAFLDRAERLQRQFFQPVRGMRRPNWEPPVDIFETEDELLIVAALPGVAADEVELVIDGPLLIVAGERHIPVEARAAVIHRLEIPHGRFERRIELPPGRFEIGQRELAGGCLLLSLRKLA